MESRLTVISDNLCLIVTGEGIAMSKKMCLRESCNIISSSKPSTKSPSSVLPAAKNEFMGFCYASGDFTGKSPSNPRRRTTDSRLAACGSSVRAPLKYLVKNKTKLVSSSDSICLPSTPKLSSYISPASSIDGWSSESSSTSINQRSKSSAASLVNTPLREIYFDFSSSKASDSERPRYGKTLGHEIHETKLMDIQFNNVLMCTSTGSPNVSRKPTPSGLRMPSPKIGFFDAVSYIFMIFFLISRNVYFFFLISRNAYSLSINSCNCVKKFSIYRKILLF